MESSAFDVLTERSPFLSSCAILETFDQSEIVDEPEEDSMENGGAEDHYSGDLQTFENNGPAFPQFRRKSIIPVDETVLDELSRHRSLDEMLDMHRASSNAENE